MQDACKKSSSGALSAAASPCPSPSPTLPKSSTSPPLRTRRVQPDPADGAFDGGSFPTCPPTRRGLHPEAIHSVVWVDDTAVYNALDANANLGASARAKLQDACKKSSSGALLDAATGAPFGHQLQLILPENAHFDPVKRGLALLIAGRSVGVETSGTTALAIT